MESGLFDFNYLYQSTLINKKLKLTLVFQSHKGTGEIKMAVCFADIKNICEIIFARSALPVVLSKTLP